MPTKVSPIPDAVVVDFDGTIALADVGDEMCERFADPGWREIDLRWVRKEISLGEAQRQMWGTMRAAPEALVAFARQVGALRPGLDAFLDRCAGRGAEVFLASGGFDFYIQAVLGEARWSRFAARFCNVGRPEAGGVAVAFPHQAELGCPLCAVCKGRVCAALAVAGRRVAFVGDGTSDRCVIGQAHQIFAVRGGKLAAACRAAGAAATEFDSFDELA
jgi:2-hydroxy-3-keto-5-methylthiopentenyl-1-phosphate phosphatase